MALSPRAAQPVRGYDEEYCADKPTGRRIGISLSGGGIRSAAFNLGALQALQEEGCWAARSTSRPSPAAATSRAP